MKKLVLLFALFFVGCGKETYEITQNKDVTE